MRRLATFLLTLALCLLPGCASIRPDHVTVLIEHDGAETSGNGRGSRTSTLKEAVSATYDLSR